MDLELVSIVMDLAVMVTVAQRMFVDRKDLITVSIRPTFLDVNPAPVLRPKSAIPLALTHGPMDVFTVSLAQQDQFFHVLRTKPSPVAAKSEH